MKSTIESLKKRKISGVIKLFCWIALLSGIGFFIFFSEVTDIARRYSLIWNMHIAEGTVQRVDVKGTRKSKSYDIVVSYTADLGHGRRILSGTYRQRLPFLVPSRGESVTIVYDPDEPHSIEPVAIEFFGVAIAAIRLLIAPILTCLTALAGAAFLYLCFSAGIAYEKRMAAYFFHKATRNRMTPTVESSKSRPPPDQPPRIWREQERLSPDNDDTRPPRHRA